jgi:diguanylate cyclase (GGDEF)-like protein
MTIDTRLKAIVKLCLSVDRQAYQTYINLSSSFKRNDLKLFWKNMAEEEHTHINFWKYLLTLTEQGIIPQVFDNPEKVIIELQNCGREARKIVNESKTIKTISKAFLAALRMEFHLLHPAFNTLFHYMKIVEEKNKWNPEEEYESHINEFIDAFHRYGKSTQEMSLLGLTLNRLWHENKNLVIMSSTDVLTGILNRRGFFNVIQPLSYLAQRNNLSLGFMMIDIDHFKQINDRYGHQKGDKILAKIASILRTNIRTSDIIGRYGGEEFIVFLSSVKPEYIESVAEKLRTEVEQSFEEDTKVTISIGVSYGMLIEENIDEQILNLINKADSCLYDAKRMGRNKVVGCHV